MSSSDSSDSPVPECSGEVFNRQSDDAVDVETELTNKFLNGEMSFADYSSEWYGKEDTIEDEDDVTVTKNNPAKHRRRKCSQLSLNLLGLMGEANLRCARGELEIAEKMCHEIIRQVPSAPEPYQTLALIYENDPEKSLQLSLFAAHLGKPDADEWLRLANLFLQRKDAEQELICLTHAIRANPSILETHLRRLKVLETIEELKIQTQIKLSKSHCYHKIVKSLPSSEAPTIMEFAKKAVTLYHSNNETNKALEVTKLAYSKCSSFFTMQDVNLYLELLMGEEEYETCIAVFVASVGVEIEAEVHTISVDGQIEEHTNYLSCQIPFNVPIDIKSKLVICLIHLKAMGLVQTLLDSFLNNDVEKAPDLYMDIEEAFTAVGEHEMALKMLQPLINSKKFDLGAVWLKHAECLYNLGKKEESIESYYKVVHHAPLHIHARLRIFEILENMGKIDEAMKALDQDYSLVVSGRLLYTYAKVLKKYNNTSKYLEVGETLLSKTFARYRYTAEFKIARMVKSSIDLIHNFRTMCGEDIGNADDVQFNVEEDFKLSTSEEWELFTDLLKVAFDNKMYHVMQRLAFGALISKTINAFRSDIDFYCLQAALLNKDYKQAFPFVREIALKNSSKYPALNLLNYEHFEGNNYGKFLMRLFQKEDNLYKYLFFGNNYLNSGRYLIALKNYLQFFETNKDPLTALLISVTLLVMAAQRTVDKHHNLILQGFAYLLTYKKLRKCDHECFYNFGRAFQMLNINNLAIEYYERALSSTVDVKCDNHKHIDLTRETAYNLYVLYKEHSPNVARMYLQKYIVI